MKCKCETCGKQWTKGEEGDNEKFCLRCCEEDRITRDDYDPDDDHSMDG